MRFIFDTDLISKCEIKKPYTALVFSYLFEYCKKNNGNFDKSILFLTAELKLARKTVYEAISELMEKQYLIKELNEDTNKKVPNVYKVDFDKIEAAKKNRITAINKTDKQIEKKNILPALPNIDISSNDNINTLENIDIQINNWLEKIKINAKKPLEISNGGKKGESKMIEGKESYYTLCLDSVDNPKILLLLLMYYDVRQDINKRIVAKSIAQKTINAFANITIAVQMVCLNAGRSQDVERKIKNLTKDEKEVFNNKQRKIQLILDYINKDKLDLDIRQQTLILD